MDTLRSLRNTFFCVFALIVLFSHSTNGQFIQDYQYVHLHEASHIELLLTVYGTDGSRSMVLIRVSELYLEHTSSLFRLTTPFLLAYWRRTLLDNPQPVVIPQNTLAIYYNCYYMRSICQNNLNWLASPRAQGRSIVRYLGGGNTNVYAFDVGKGNADLRGRKMCPPSWKKNHPCPETNAAGVVIQPEVMPGPWLYNVREVLDPLHINEIAADWIIDPMTNQMTIRERSGRYFTCEEWPPRR